MRPYSLSFLPVLSFSLLLALLSPHAFAQHEGHVMPDGTIMSDEDMPGVDMSGMAHGSLLSEPMGSGTTWLPSGSPVHDHALHFMVGEWMFMTHGEVIARYTAQNLNHPDRNPPVPSATGGTSLYPELERGGTRYDAPNWVMLSAERTVFDDDRLMLRTMMSLDPLTIGDEGYPLLYQTGEGLVDRQHAHDLFMELAILYSHPLTANNRVFAYFGLPGEPSIGPSAFMHRPSAGGNPDAPLGHHFQDATHITYGVATLGWIYRRTKAEVSTFRGREPDAQRWNIDVGAFDSYSMRLTQSLGNFTVQGSMAYIHEPEPDEHGDVLRTTFAVHHNKAIANGNWASSFVMGLNAGHHGRMLHSFLREMSLEKGSMAFWLRVETLQRMGAELDLPAGHEESQFWVNAVTLGTGVTLFKVSGMELFLGGQGALNFGSPALEPYYGKLPLSGQVFIKLRPARPAL